MGKGMIRKLREFFIDPRVLRAGELFDAELAWRQRTDLEVENAALQAEVERLTQLVTIADDFFDEAWTALINTGCVDEDAMEVTDVPGTATDYAAVCRNIMRAIHAAIVVRVSHAPEVMGHIDDETPQNKVSENDGGRSGGHTTIA